METRGLVAFDTVFFFLFFSWEFKGDLCCRAYAGGSGTSVQQNDAVILSGATSPSTDEQIEWGRRQELELELGG